jgi:hypothetical protein
MCDRRTPVSSSNLVFPILSQSMETPGGISWLADGHPTGVSFFPPFFVVQIFNSQRCNFGVAGNIKCGDAAFTLKWKYDKMPAAGAAVDICKLLQFVCPVSLSAIFFFFCLT